VTDNEKIEQEVRLGVETKHAITDLAHERERTLRLAADLDTWANWLRGHANKQPSAADFMGGASASDLTLRSDGRYRECLNFDTLVRAEEDLRMARQKASNLELRKMQLSSPSGFQIKI
jgi:3'-phosphoadenosine 5'-phosphosulfate sulfotransferase